MPLQIPDWLPGITVSLVGWFVTGYLSNKNTKINTNRVSILAQLDKTEEYIHDLAEYGYEVVSLSGKDEKAKELAIKIQRKLPRLKSHIDKILSGVRDPSIYKARVALWELLTGQIITNFERDAYSYGSSVHKDINESADQLIGNLRDFVATKIRT
jgi:hypothetical protein